VLFLAIYLKTYISYKLQNKAVEDFSKDEQIYY